MEFHLCLNHFKYTLSQEREGFGVIRTCQTIPLKVYLRIYNIPKEVFKAASRLRLNFLAIVVISNLTLPPLLLSFHTGNTLYPLLGFVVAAGPEICQNISHCCDFFSIHFISMNKGMSFLISAPPFHRKKGTHFSMSARIYIPLKQYICAPPKAKELCVENAKSVVSHWSGGPQFLTPILYMADTSAMDVGGGISWCTSGLWKSISPYLPFAENIR